MGSYRGAQAIEMFTTNALGGWENEGGALARSAISSKTALTGTANQIAWAQQIREQVGEEFDRIRNALTSVATRQAGPDRTDTNSLVGLLEERRREVMANSLAGYFIHDWQELGDQVRQLVVKDPVYEAIKAKREERKRKSKTDLR
jgi:hypothetical protein